MPDLFSPFTLKGVTLRNRIAMSPMTMYRSTNGLANDYHVMLLGSRAAGGFGLVFTEQLAIVKEGRTSVSCGGIYDDAQIEGLQRCTRIVKDMGDATSVSIRSRAASARCLHRDVNAHLELRRIADESRNI
jgi:2,4-dienoyl-CoA reductase-like NADH-dependent reductase (Old Yellow Enzyme family)